MSSSTMYSGFAFRLWILLTAALLPVFNLFLFGSFNLLAGNPEEFEAGFRSLLGGILPVAGLGVLALTGLGLLLPGRWWQRYACFLLGLGVLIWAQGAFLAGDYGVLDGRGLHWEAFAWPAWLDIGLWVVVIGAVVAFHRHLLALVIPASWILIAVQTVGAAVTGTVAEERLWSRTLTVEDRIPEEITEFSTDRNIVHVVLDNFQTDVFEELVAEQGLEDELDGFVLFRENAAVAPYTSLAVPSIFAGRVYDGSVSPGEFYRQGIKAGFHAKLYERGYTVNLIPMRSMRESPHTTHFPIPDVFGGTEQELLRREIGRLLDVTLFRHAPHLARGWIYNDNNWRIQALFTDPDDLPKSFHHKRFFRHYIENLGLGDNAPAYHFMHLWPPHPPYVTTPDGQYAGKALPNERDHYVDEARDILLLFVDFVEALKELGIYDNALVILHSDHGGAFEPEFSPTRMFTLKAVKPRQGRGRLKVSNAPVSLADVAATILAEEGLDLEWPGRSVFEVDEDEERTRRFVFYHGDRKEFLKPVAIDGSLYSPDSYTYLDSISIDEARDVFVYGEMVETGLRGTGGVYLHGGWSSRAPGHVWSNSHQASLRIPIQTPRGDLLFTAAFIPNVHPPEIPRQRVIIEINGQQLDAWSVEERRFFEREVLVPAELISGPELTITFRLPDAISQVEAGVGGDQRLLAIALSRFGLQEIKP